MDVVKEAVDQGETYQDHREGLVTLCLDVLNNFTDYNGDVMCEGIMDRFAPQASFRNYYIYSVSCQQPICLRSDKWSFAYDPY